MSDDLELYLDLTEQGKRIEELEKACAEWAEVSQSNYQRAKAAEAKLAKAVAFLEFLDGNYRHAFGDTARAKNTGAICRTERRHPMTDTTQDDLVKLSLEAGRVVNRIEALTAERDHWKRVAVREGVCMSCRGPSGHFDPHGCTDCLNTGYCGEHHNLMHALEAKLKTAEEIGRAFEENAGQLREKLEKADWMLIEAMVQLREGKAHTRRNRADLIELLRAELEASDD